MKISEHACFLYGAPSNAARVLPEKQKDVIQQIRTREGGTISIHEIQSVSRATLRKMRNRGLIHMHTGGAHGGSHKGWLELTGYGESVGIFLETTP